MVLTRIFFAAQFERQIAHGGFQGRFGDAHDVVAGHGFLAAEVGQGDDRSAIGHQGRGGAGQGDQAVGADVQGLGEDIAGSGGEDTFSACEVIAIGERQAVDEEVDGAEFFLGGGEEFLDLIVLGDVAGMRARRRRIRLPPSPCGRGVRIFRDCPWGESRSRRWRPA